MLLADFFGLIGHMRRIGSPFSRCSFWPCTGRLLEVRNYHRTWNSRTWTVWYNRRRSAGQKHRRESSRYQRLLRPGKLPTEAGESCQTKALCLRDLVSRNCEVESFCWRWNRRCCQSIEQTDATLPGAEVFTRRIFSGRWSCPWHL
jgi:hypothetical protein